jgi:signal transduction histidine kinase
MDSDHVDRRPARPGVSRFRPTDATSVAGDPQDTLTHLASALAESLDVPIAYVALREARRLVLSGLIGQSGKAPEWREMALEGSACGTAVAAGEAVMVSDLSTDPTYAASAELELLGAVSFAAFPLALQSGETIGALCAGRLSGGEWTSRDRAVMTHLAAAATLVLRHRSAINAAAALADAVGNMEAPLQRLTDQVRRLTTLVADHDDPRVRTIAALADSRVREVDELMRVARAAARPALGHPTEGQVATDLVELVRRSAASATSVSASEVFRFDTELKQVMVRCDPLELEQSLTTLLLTMAQYAAGTAEIHLRLREGVGTIRIDVIDLGLGVPAAELARMVSRVQIPSSSTSGMVRLVGGVVFADRGGVRARSSARGTAFRIPLPRA